ncbi:MAG: hypothetical protein JXA13_03680 [Anaerolineales bacterium]|nr:hypothetical protein [Anaerolineales bacterium]
MYTLAPDEKKTMVFVYASDLLLRGEAVTKESILVSRWLRTDSAPNFMQILNAQLIMVSGGTVKTFNYPEVLFPTEQCLAFHIAPPTRDPLDYEEDEPNRMMALTHMLVGSFLFDGKLRVSTQTDIGTSLDVSRSPWLSFYEVNISNPFLPQLKMQVPMLLIRPERVCFAMNQ